MRIAALLVFLCCAAPAASATIPPFDLTPTGPTLLPSFADRVLSSPRPAQAPPVLTTMGLYLGKTDLVHLSLLLIYATCMASFLPASIRRRAGRKR